MNKAKLNETFPLPRPFPSVFILKDIVTTPKMIKLIIKTSYEIIRDGDSFNELDATTEMEIHSLESIQSIIDLHEEKEGKYERVVRTQLKDLLTDEEDDF